MSNLPKLDYKKLKAVLSKAAESCKNHPGVSGTVVGIGAEFPVLCDECKKPAEKDSFLDKKAAQDEAAVQQEVETSKAKVTANPNTVEDAMNTLKYLHLLPTGKLNMAKTKACQVLQTLSPGEYKKHCVDQ